MPWAKEVNVRETRDRLRSLEQAGCTRIRLDGVAPAPLGRGRPKPSFFVAFLFLPNGDRVRAEGREADQAAKSLANAAERKLASAS